MSRKRKHKNKRAIAPATQPTSAKPRHLPAWFDPDRSRARAARALQRGGQRPRLVGFEAVGIQEFITANGRPLAMEGASALIRQFDEANLARDGVVFAGGGRGLLLVDESELDATIEDLRACYRKATAGGQLAVASVTFDAGEQAAGLRWLRAKLDGAKDSADPPEVQLPGADGRVCSDCKVHAQTTEYSSAEGPVPSCLRCATVVEAGHALARSRWTFEEISSEGVIAVVSADGNNLGALFANLATLEDHAICSDVVAAIFARAHQAACPRNAAFIAPVTGGDDIRVILPPKQLIAYVTRLAAEVEASCRELAGCDLSPTIAAGLARLGVGVGAVIAPFHYPAHRLVTMAHEFEDSAKRACLIHRRRSAFDFVWLKSGEELSQGVAALERGDVDATALALDDDAAAGLLVRARALKRLPSSQRAMIVRARGELDEREFMNLFCYQVARSEGWQRYFETCGIDWRNRGSIADNLPSQRMLDIAELVDAA